MTASLPLLLLDVDGVLNPFAARACPPGYTEHEFFPGEDPVRLCPAHGPWLHELATRFQIVWATAWGADANRLLAPLLQIPDLPVIGFPPVPFHPRDKLLPVIRFAGRRPLTWIDDALSPQAHAWAAKRGIPTLLISIDPAEGLTRPVIDQSLQWADGQPKMINPNQLRGHPASPGLWWPLASVCNHESMSSRRMEWAVAGALAGWAAARLAGADRLRFAEAWAVPLLSFTPQVTAGAWASALLLGGAGPAAAAAAAGAALTAVVGPRAVPYRQPPAAGPVLRVLTANLLFGRAAAKEVVELACRTHADVLFVQELTDDAAARLQRAGLDDLLPYRVTQPTPHDARGSIYARYPLRGGPPAAPPSAARCTARLDLPSGQFVELACIHAGPPRPPWAPDATARWRSQLSALPAPGDSPRILAGDFNATLDHAQFRRLLRRGYVDAASQAGHGLSLTWGLQRSQRLTLLAIDHVLIDRRCAVLTTSAHRLTGSDHRALYAELRFPAPRSLGDQAPPTK